MALTSCVLSGKQIICACAKGSSPPHVLCLPRDDNIIFSSLISEEMRRKGRDLGADEQLTKPEIGHLVDVMDHLLERFDKQHSKG